MVVVVVHCVGKKRHPFYLKNKSVADLYKIFGRKYPEKTCYKSFQFCPPHLKIVTTLPCENLKSYFSSLYYYFTTMSGLDGTNMKLSTMWHNSYSKCTTTGVDRVFRHRSIASYSYHTQLEASPRAHQPLPQICHVLYWRVVDSFLPITP